MISAECEAEIIRLFHAEKWPVGTISAELGVHHSVVERVLGQAGLQAKRQGRPSILEPYLPFILQTLEKYPRLRSTRLFHMLKERGYPGGPDHVRHTVARYRPRRVVEAYQRLRTLPGEQAQVDWAHFGKFEVGRALRTLFAFVMVLSWSRQVFLRFFLSSAMPMFLRGHVEAFNFFSGVPRVLLYDNLKSAVLERVGDAIRFNPTLVELSRHYCFEPRPVAPARGNEKGRVERAIRFIRESFFAARSFKDVADLNQQALAWMLGTSQDRRSPEDRTKTVREAFEEEKPKLLPLPDDAFPIDERVEVEVGKTPYVRFDLNDYSVPAAFTQKTLLVVASLETVRIVDATTVIASHQRSWDRAQQIEDQAHLEELGELKKRALRHRGFDRLAHAAPSSRRFFELAASHGKNLGTLTSRLLELLDTVGPTELENALQEVVAHELSHIGAVRQVLDRLLSERGEPPIVVPRFSTDKFQGLVVRPHSLDTYDRLGKEVDDEHS